MMSTAWNLHKHNFEGFGVKEGTYSRVCSCSPISACFSLWDHNELQGWIQALKLGVGQINVEMAWKFWKAGVGVGGGGLKKRGGSILYTYISNTIIIIIFYIYYKYDIFQTISLLQLYFLSPLIQYYNEKSYLKNSLSGCCPEDAGIMKQH